MGPVQLLLDAVVMLAIITICYGQTKSDVCGGHLTAQTGTVQTPNFPSNYPEHVTCMWAITVAEKQVITLRFHRFGVDINDGVVFYDGDSTRNTVIADNLKGSWNESNENFRIRTTGHNLLIIFTSNGKQAGTGFSASYWAHACDPFTYGDKCDKNCSCSQENTLYCNSITSQCVCKNGWKSTSCDVDINECDDPNICPDLYSMCYNTKGSYKCLCKTGLQLNATGHCLSTCVPEQNNCSNACGVIPTSQACGVTSTNPYIEQCYCPKGMHKNSSNSQSCVECSDMFYGENCQYKSSCNSQNTKSVNPANGLCTCYLNWTSTNCTEDFDECSVNACNSTNSHCENTIGSYKCRCRYGYENVNPTFCNECGKTLTNPSGIISSPYYNDYYSSYNQKNYDICSWIISVEKGLVIDIRFSVFSLYIGYHIPSGYVTIYDGSSVTAPLLRRLDGLNYHNGRLPPNNIRSSGNELYIIRTAEYSSYGFKASYTSHECKDFFYDTNCSTPCNCFKSNTDYCNSTTGQCMCKPQWTSPDCTVDKNECLVDPLACPNYSDCKNLQPGFGCDCKMGMEKDAKGLCDYSSASSTLCTQRKCSHVCVKLKSTLEEKCYCPIGMVLVGDTCTNCSNDSYGQECSLKCSCEENNTASCDPVTGQCVCLPGWTSDNCSQDVDECYFDLYVCPKDSSCRNLLGDYACDCSRSQGYENNGLKTCKPIICSYILTEASGSITSPDYPGTYFRNANCSWLITANEGNVITIRFEKFSVGFNDRDYIVFYNGNSTSPKVIGRYSGQIDSIPHIIRSNSNRMFINFISSSNYWDNNGFKATYVSHTCRPFTFGETCSEYCHCNSENYQFCDNIKGDCMCKPGWSGHTCFDDVDECLGTNNVLCPSNSDCVNTPGSYTCKCHPGFVKNVSTGLCDVSKECYMKKCSHTCYTQNGKEKCACPDGLELDVTGLVCVVPYYPYGSGANDEMLSSQMYGSSLYHGAILVSPPIYFSTAVPFGNSQNMYKVAYVMSNGLFVFGDESIAISASPNLNLAFSQKWNIVAPYWTNTKPNSGHVNYHVYEKCGQAAYDGTNDDSKSQHRIKVMTRASQDLIKYYGFIGFTVEKVLVLTWVDVQQIYGTENSTFQAVFISGWKKESQNGQEMQAGEQTSYVIFMYQQGKMNWPYIAGRLISIGFTGNNLPFTNTVLASRLDKMKGNTGFDGVFTFKTGSSSSSLQKCHSYTCSKINLLSNPVYENDKRTLYVCPCTMERLGSQWQLYETHGEKNDIECYAISHIAKNRLLASNIRNKLCCYKREKPHNPSDWRDVERTMREASYVPNSGHVLINDPWPLYYFNNYEARENIEAHETCCTMSNKNLCDRFYKIFPDMGCSNFVVFVPASAFGDPHITTLDGVTYPLNVWGEYILMEIKSKKFMLQCRTRRIEGVNGTLSNATVFIAFAAKEGDYAKFQVELATNNITLVIYVNDLDITNDFNNDEEFNTVLDQISVMRKDSSNRTFVIAIFPCGVTIKVYVAMKSLNIEFEIDKNLQNKTLGLLGNFNLEKSDEFTLPNGVVLPSNMSERDIFYSFGQKWKVTSDNTVFMYGKRESFSTYQHSDFEPVFGDEASPYIIAEAENYCGINSPACVFDYIVTGSEEFALSTNESFLKLKSLVTNLINTPPTLSLKNENLNAFDQWVVNEGVQNTLEVLTEDDDGDVVNLEILDKPTGVFVKNKSIIYTANSSLPMKLGLRAKDSKGAYSPIVYVYIAVCTSCNGHGICANITRDIEYFNGYFQIFKCSCHPAYTGADCELELDACASKPCSVGQECTDLTAAQQGNNLTGYLCDTCPDGYNRSNATGSCIDIDECTNKNDGCQHNCTNTIGSYQCSCRDGYRLDLSDRKTCKDINECEEQTARCQQKCKNTEGSYNCSCFEGYLLKSNGYNCELPISGLQKCSQCQHTCIFNKINNSASCTCDKGYLQDEQNDAECKDIDECKLDNMPCTQGCNNTEGHFNCYCYPGYMMESDRVSCKACEVPYYGDNCNKTCDCNGRGSCNTVKGCVCDVNWTGVNCDIDVDECVTPGACPEGQHCENTNGSFTCLCPIGYIMEGSVCKDVDECFSFLTNGTCNLQTEVCINTVGSYRCECKHGYARDNKSFCKDIDECTQQIDDCQHLCHNVDGGYNCECEAGYLLADNRQNCINVQDLCKASNMKCVNGCTLDAKDKPVCICPRGYNSLVQNGFVTCVDINECASAENNSCSYKPGCNNTDGGYTCSCPAGFKLDNNGRNCLACSGDTWSVGCSHSCTCGIGAERCDPVKGCVCKSGYTGDNCNIDINECTSGALICKEREVCINLRGSAKCECQSGYEYDGFGRCLDINECYKNNDCSQICTNVEGSYSCSCYSGFTFNITSNTCLDVDECKLQKHQCEQICTNTDGSYHCSCTDDLVLQMDGVSCGAENPCTSISCTEKCAKINGIDTCLCGKGKTLAMDKTSCNDLDLCKTTLCTEGCVETKENKTFECLCNIGKYLAADGITCTECIAGKYGINCNKSCTCQMANSKTCDKVNGACICLPGWKGENCTIDVDECADNSVSCPEHSYCLNTNGSYVCVCNDGFIQNGNICADLDLCKLSPCTESCVETKENTSFQCLCNIGKYLASDGFTCTECIDGKYGMNCNNSCNCERPNTKTCDNVNGACKCLPGWKGDNCATDVDECADDSGSCQEHSHCVNTNGSYVCVCDDGFILKEKICGDLPFRHTVSLIVIIDYNMTGFDISNKNSDNYLKLSEAAQKGLLESLKKEATVILVTIMNLRQGSLIINTDITMATNNTTDKASEMKIAMVLLEILKNGIGITINNIKGDILHLIISGVEILKDDTPCKIKSQLDPCAASETCKDEGEEAVCRTQEDDESQKLLLGLSIGLSLFALLCIVIIFIVCYFKRETKRVQNFDPQIKKS